MKRKFLKILNRYSLIYLPLGWVIGLAIIFFTFEPSSVLYFLTFNIITIFYLFVSYKKKKKMVDSSYSVSDYKNSIIEFYSDY